MNNRWNLFTLTVGLLLILLVTLFPFDFLTNTDWLITPFTDFCHHPSNPLDFIGNILLFIPFSFGLTGWMYRQGLETRVVFFLVLLISLTLSVTVEILQIFLPSRSSTLLDILANSLGGCWGCLGALKWGDKINSLLFIRVVKIPSKLSTQFLCVAFLFYTLTILCLSLSLPIPLTNFRNWDFNFPLLMGNEKTGNRSWNGYISEVWITNCSIDQEEVKLAFSTFNYSQNLDDSLIAFYPLNYSERLQDKTHNLPDLVWQGIPTNITENLGVFLDNNNYLSTVKPASVLTQNLYKTSELTISLKIATLNLQQTGPARIISLSNSPYERNFTLGQERTDLIFRLRTPMTGKNSDHPEFLIRDVFRDQTPHHIIVTYANSRLRIYIDQVQNLYTFELAPVINFFQLTHLLANPVNSVSIKSYTILYYGLIFVPLGILLGLIVEKMKTNQKDTKVN